MKCTFDGAQSRSLHQSSTGDYRVLIAMAHLSVYHANSSLYLTCTSSYFDEIWCNQSSTDKSLPSATAVMRGYRRRPLPLG